MAALVEQIRRTFQKQNRLAALVGAVLGGFVPLATFTLAHNEVDLGTWRGWVALLLVLGGLAYSAPNLYGWGLTAFRSKLKAVGFVVLLEGSMTLCRSAWVSAVALALLVLVNALVTACAIADDQKAAHAARRKQAAKPAPRPMSKPQAKAVVRKAIAPRRKTPPKPAPSSLAA